MIPVRLPKAAKIWLILTSSSLSRNLFEIQKTKIAAQIETKVFRIRPKPREIGLKWKKVNHNKIGKLGVSLRYLSECKCLQDHWIRLKSSKFIQKSQLSHILIKFKISIQTYKSAIANESNFAWMRITEFRLIIKMLMWTYMFTSIPYKYLT